MVAEWSHKQGWMASHHSWSSGSISHHHGSSSLGHIKLPLTYSLMLHLLYLWISGHDGISKYLNFSNAHWRIKLNQCISLEASNILADLLHIILSIFLNILGDKSFFPKSYVEKLQSYWKVARIITMDTYISFN